MDTNNEILDAIEILADKKIGDNITKVLTGICTSVNINKNTCVMDSNGVSGTVYFYGSPPEVNGLYRIFVPSNDMSRSFIIVPPKFTVNPNLLDNWYFANPVNQRNGYIVPAGVEYYKVDGFVPQGPIPETVRVDYIDYAGSARFDYGGVPCYVPKDGGYVRGYTGNGYTVDRWIQGFDGTLTSTLTDDGIKVMAGNDGTYKNFEQPLPDVPINSTFTLSFLVDNYTFVNQIYTGWGIGQFNFHDNLISLTFKTGSSISGRKSVGIQVKVGKTAIIKAAKLELGSQQTLAHLENGNWVLNEIPKYEDVLSNCQRYVFNVVNSDDNYEILGGGFAMNTSQFFCFIPTPVTLRGKPTVKYSGSFRAVRNTSAAGGIVINSISVDHASNNGVSVVCVDATSSFEVGEYYTLWCIPVEETNSLIFSADL